MICERIPLYETREDVTLTTYLWDDAADMLDGAARPAVLICPGGAYLTCSDKEGEPVALAFAAMGYHTFVLRYSVYSEGKAGADMFASSDEGVKPHCLFPWPMRDIGAAMLFIRSRAEEWHVNMEELAICGFSAGAHNCAMYSVYYDREEIAGYFGEAPERLRPAACILGYSLTDYRYMEEHVFTKRGAMEAELFARSNLSLLGTEQPATEALDQVSPCQHVSAHTPPMYLWATAQDNLVPVQNSLIMARALADAKVPFELHIFEEGMHGLGLATEAGAGNLWDVNQEAAKWVPMCHSWLAKRFHLPLKEKPFWA